MGANAYASTGEKSGTIDRVIVEPDSWVATYLVLGKGDVLPSDKLVEISMVQNWSERGVELRLSLDDIKRLPDYIHRQYATPREFLPTPRPAQGGNLPARELFTQEGKPYGPGILPHETRPIEETAAPEQPPQSGPIQLRDGETVEAVDGELGRLDQLLLDVYTDRLNTIVVKGDGTQWHVPVEWIAYIDPDRVRLAADREQAEHLVGPPAGNYLPEEPDQGGSRRP